MRTRLIAPILLGCLISGIISLIVFTKAWGTSHPYVPTFVLGIYTDNPKGGFQESIGTPNGHSFLWEEIVKSRSYRDKVKTRTKATLGPFHTLYSIEITPNEYGPWPWLEIFTEISPDSVDAKANLHLKSTALAHSSKNITSIQQHELTQLQIQFDVFAEILSERGTVVVPTGKVAVISNDHGSFKSQLHSLYKPILLSVILSSLLSIVASYALIPNVRLGSNG